MKHTAAAAILVSAALLTACHKKEKAEEAQAAATPAPAAAPAPAAPPAEPSADQQERENKQKLLDYGVMEDKYINDPRGQWATEATASSVFGDENGRKPSENNLPKSATGAPDGNEWTNNNIDKGFDWLQLGYAKPVNATEVRVVIPDDKGPEAVNKIELQDTDGKWNTVWEGLSDVKRDTRGGRTWFVKTFEKTVYKAKAVKITFANNVQHTYKEVDAVQLVGDQ
ncbi:hypothetical protein ACLB1G_25160 [Oxalobacteraceae bacterium A2-2]